jgi:hypothetical protein
MELNSKEQWRALLAKRSAENAAMGLVRSQRRRFQSLIAEALEQSVTSVYPTIAAAARDDEVKLALYAIRDALASGTFPYTGWPSERPTATWGREYRNAKSWGIDIGIIDTPPLRDYYTYTGNWGSSVVPSTLRRLRKAAEILRMKEERGLLSKISPGSPQNTEPC